MRSVFPTSSEPCSALPRLGAEVLAVVGRYRDGARAFYYEVMLSGQSCPRCGGGLVMAAEGRCRCTGCGAEFDPTVEFQRCSSCDGVPRIRARHYECSRCRAVIASRFLFDGLVFDAAYFRQKMAEHRQRQRESRDRVRAMLAENRSPPLAPMTADAVGTAGLWEALNHLAMVPPPGVAQTRERFDLQRYQTHVRAHVGTIAVSLEKIPPLSEDARLDRVWRFVAIIFLAHAGEIRIGQDNDTIWVQNHEADGEGQAVPGDLEGTHAVEGPVGGVEA